MDMFVVTEVVVIEVAMVNTEVVVVEDEERLYVELVEEVEVAFALSSRRDSRTF